MFFAFFVSEKTHILENEKEEVTEDFKEIKDTARSLVFYYLLCMHVFVKELKVKCNIHNSFILYL